jgi:hypothetical protein
MPKSTPVIYDSPSEALSVALRSARRVSKLPAPTLQKFLERESVVEEIKPTKEHRPRHFAPALVGKFAIRNDALFNLRNFLRLITAALNLVVGLSGISTLAGAAATVDALHALYTFYLETKEQGFILTPEQLAVVGILRDLGKAKPAEISARLKLKIEPADVEAILEGFRRTDNRRTGFTVRDKSGLWSLSGL